jgi:hypothetical protein
MSAPTINGCPEHLRSESAFLPRPFSEFAATKNGSYLPRSDLAAASLFRSLLYLDQKMTESAQLRLR